MRKGFTLIELIITIVLIGIVAGLGVNIIVPIVTGYTDTRNKNFLYNEAKFSFERIDRELRNAIPNTIRVSSDNTSIQFALFLDAAYYDNVSNNGDNTDNISYDGTDNLTIGSKISIYNTASNYFFTNTSSEQRIYTINALTTSGSNKIAKLDKEIISNSPYKRLFIINTPVTLCKQGNNILRCFGYQIEDDYHCNDGTGTCNVLTSYVNNVSFQYIAGTTERTAMVKISLTLTKDDLTLTYNHEVHIRNVP